jgi:regulator of protease activity HflC (stomatin/prohibitin superfamily)
MATISSLVFWRHVRGEPTAHLVFFKDGRVRKSGRGLSFWFSPLGASLAEVPLDDRELPFLFHAFSSDFQEVTVQGVITYRVVAPEVLAQRVDFAVDTRTGVLLRQPLDKLAAIVTERAQELSAGDIARSPLRAALDAGIERIREAIHAGLAADDGLSAMGLEIVSTRVSSIKPTAEMERALQMPAREAIQQQADEATFSRRALAVEKERAIASNELSNKIELARQKQALIEQEGQNQRRSATEKAEAQRIEADAAALRKRTESTAEADSIRAIEDAKVTAERDRMAIYRDLPSAALLGLAARDLAGNLPPIQHLSLGPDTLGPMLTRLLHAGADRLEGGSKEAP